MDVPKVLPRTKIDCMMNSLAINAGITCMYDDRRRGPQLNSYWQTNRPGAPEGGDPTKKQKL